MAAKMKPTEDNSYQRILGDIFKRNFKRGSDRVPFKREELASACKRVGVAVPKNLGDIIYAARYRGGMPEGIAATAPAGKDWLIKPEGRASYVFALVTRRDLSPDTTQARIKVPDATPGIVVQHAQSDEQALLAKVRYNRLIDAFLGAVCYSLQSHMRTQVKGVGQIEVDELYVGFNKDGAQYVIPVQAKGGRDKLSAVQIGQDFALCVQKFTTLVCRPVGAQFLADGTIALIEFVEQDSEIRKAHERHYTLIDPSQISSDDLAAYRARTSG